MKFDYWLSCHLFAVKGLVLTGKVGFLFLKHLMIGQRETFKQAFPFSQAWLRSRLKILLFFMAFQFTRKTLSAFEKKKLSSDPKLIFPTQMFPWPSVYCNSVYWISQRPSKANSHSRPPSTYWPLASSIFHPNESLLSASGNDIRRVSDLMCFHWWQSFSRRFVSQVSLIIRLVTASTLLRKHSLWSIKY